MTGNTYFKNAGIILIFFLRIYKTHLFTNSNFVFAVYESMGHKEMDMTGQLNKNNVNHTGRPRGSDGKESACKTEDLGSILGWGRHPGGGKGNPLQRVTEEHTVWHSSLNQV